MSKKFEAGPKIEKLPVDKMPIDRLREVLPDKSGLGEVVAPPPPPPSKTGLTGGWTEETGSEPFVYDQTTFEMLAELSPGTDHGWIYSLAPVNGDLYIGGEGAAADYSSAWGILGYWDRETDSFISLLEPDMSAGGYVSSLELVGDDLYFFQYGSGLVRIGLVDTNTNEVGYLTAPDGMLSSAYGAGMTAHENKLVVVTNSYNQFATDTDIAVYDTVAASWSQYYVPNGWSLTNGDPLIVNSKVYFGGGTGSGYWWDPARFSIYSLDLSTGTVAMEYFNAQMASGDYEGVTSGGFGTDGEDFYFSTMRTNGFATTGYDILKLDTATSDITSVFFSSSQALYMFAESDTGVYFGAGENAVWDIVKVSEDAAGQQVVTIFDLDTQFTSSIVFGGSLYYGANGDLYRLNETTMQAELVNSFGLSGTYDVQPLNVVNGYLAVSADTDGNGRGELWVSATPNDPNSWAMISGAVAVEPVAYNAVLDGDYLLSA